VKFDCFHGKMNLKNKPRKQMSKASTFFKSTALLSLLGACAIDDPIDYTTDGYTASPQGGGSGDESNGGSILFGRVAAGGQHTCAIKADDSAQCWGDDSKGQSTVPEGLASVKSISAGHYHTCAIKADDSVQCWGMYTHVANDVPSALGSVKSISAGWWHTCAIKTDDSVQCWGDDVVVESTVPVGLSNVKSISAGGYHTCAIKADDSL